MRRLTLLTAALLCASLALPASAARRPKVDTGSYKALHYRSADGPHVTTYRHTVVLDAEEAIERHVRLVVPQGMDRVPVTVIDRALGDECEASTNGSVELTPQSSGFGPAGLKP